MEKVREGFAVGISAAIAGIIGVLVALKWVPLAWYFQILVGGSVGMVVGWITADVKGFITCFPRAYQKATSRRSRVVRKMLWRRLKRNRIMIPIMAGMVTWILSWMMVLLAMAGSDDTKFMREILPVFAIAFGYMVAAFTIIFGPLMSLDKMSKERLAWYKNITRILLIKGNPITVAVWWLPKLIIYLVKETFLAIFVAAPKFTWYLFRLSHTSKRVIVAVDGGLSAVLGLALSFLYPQHSLIMIAAGIGFGAVYAAFNYLVVSQRCTRWRREDIAFAK